MFGGMNSNGHARVAFVTGGARGIGAAIASGLAADGFAVAVADMRLAEATDTAALINDRGGSSLAVELDVTEPASRPLYPAAARPAARTITPDPPRAMRHP